MNQDFIEDRLPLVSLQCFLSRVSQFKVYIFFVTPVTQ